MSLSKEASAKKRNPTCSKCQNHGVSAPKKGHKRYCPKANCHCPRCILTTQRQENMAKQVSLRRQLVDEEAHLLQEQLRIQRQEQAEARARATAAFYQAPTPHKKVKLKRDQDQDAARKEEEQKLGGQEVFQTPPPSPTGPGSAFVHVPGSDPSLVPGRMPPRGFEKHDPCRNSCGVQKPQPLSVSPQGCHLRYALSGPRPLYGPTLAPLSVSPSVPMDMTYTNMVYSLQSQEFASPIYPRIPASYEPQAGPRAYSLAKSPAWLVVVPCNTIEEVHRLVRLAHVDPRTCQLIRADLCNSWEPPGSGPGSPSRTDSD